LYGSAARYDEKAVAPVVNQLSNEARVRFEFEVAGVAYVATRVVRRTAKGATTKEARFECGDTVLAGDAKSVTEATAA
jgi:exonuclease SbcC